MAPVYLTPAIRAHASSSDSATVASASEPTPVLKTPASVPDVTPALCLSLLEFKGALRR